MGQEYGTYDPVEVLDYHNDDAAQATAEALEVAAGDQVTWTIKFPCSVFFFGYQATVAFNYATQTAEGIIALDKVEPDATRTELGRVDLQDGTPQFGTRGITGAQMGVAADLNVGDRLVLEVVTAATGGGGIAGDWRPVILLRPRAAGSWDKMGVSFTITDLAQV